MHQSVAYCFNRKLEKAMNITIASSVKLSEKALREAPLFRDWVERLGTGWDGDVTISAADIWGSPKQVHMLQMTVARKGDPWAKLIQLRSETVDVLTVITDGTDRWVVFVEQERDATGGRVFSNVAGGRDRGETVDQAARRELAEELGLDRTRVKLQIRLTQLIKGPVLATPGSVNERVHFVQAEIVVKPKDLPAFLAELRGKKTGVAAEGEDITLCAKPADEARRFIEKQPCPDGKTLLSLRYGGL